MTARITGWLVILSAIPLLFGGAWLAMLDGSAAPALIGIGLLVVGGRLAARQRGALLSMGLLLFAVAAWSLWDVGLDRWQLVPRGAALSVLGLWLLTPWIARAVAPAREPADASRWPGERRLLAMAAVAAAAIAVLASTRDGFEIRGSLDGTAGAASPPVADAAPPASSPSPPGDDWTAYGGTGLGQRYSALADIRPTTIGQLAPAWTFHTGDQKHGGDPIETTYQVTPLKVGDLLYVCTPRSLLIALDALTGQERWRHDPKAQVGPTSQHMTCRGVGYHAAEGGGARACDRRVLLPTIDARLIALDAITGRPCEDFGDGGTVDLKAQMPNDRPGAYMQTSPPVVTRDLVIVGGSINDNERTENPSGAIRAYDVRSGRLVWRWHAAQPQVTAPPPPGATLPAGGPNMWSVASVDEVLGLAYFPLGNRSPDLLGAERSAEVDRHTSAIVALELATGRPRWVFQTVRHDLWDRDVPSQPTLLDLSVGGQRVPALIAPTKQGDLFVLDRRNGQPLVPVEDTPVPTDGAEGESPAPAQRRSALSFMPPPLTERDMWGATPWDQLWCRLQFRLMRYEGPWTPPSRHTSLVYPGNTGVFNWGGIAVDPKRELLIASPVQLAFTHRLVPREEPQARLVTDDGAEPWNENFGGRYAFEMGPFTSPLGLPCQAPPWGALVGVDLRTGETAWRRRNGTVRDSLPSWLPLPLPMGVPSLGGPLVTAGGVVFYSGTLDQALRAYDVDTGRLLWQARLPAGGQATPMTYRAGGRQFVVVAAGGHGSFGTRTGDAIVAFALPAPP